MKISHILLVISCLFSSITSLCAKELWQKGNIRIYYFLDGPHAVAPTDINHNQIPDQVEDLMTQTIASRLMFVDVLGFPDPFAGKRFKTASYLDIHILSKEKLKANGVTYDELQRFNRPGDPKGTLSICFNVTNEIKSATNLTPTHEFFHLIQHGVTYFKNRWFTEGTARWAQRALGTEGVGPCEPMPAWPLSEERMKEIGALTYGAAEAFWNPLAVRLDTHSPLPETPALATLRTMKYADGSKVLKDEKLIGWEFIREVLLELGKIDETAFRTLGYDSWAEENQRSDKNNPFIFQTVNQVVARREGK